MKHAWFSPRALGQSWSAQRINQRAALRTFATHKMVALGRLCRIESGQYIDTYVPENEASACPFVRVDNIRPFVANLSRADLVFVDRDHAGVLPRSIIQADDVVIARTGTVGKAALAVGELVGAVMSQHLTRLTVRPEMQERISPELLCAFLNSQPGRAQLLASSAGSTRLELTHERLAAVQVPLIADREHLPVAQQVLTGAESLAQAGALLRKAVASYEGVFQSEPAPGTTSPRLQWAAPGQVMMQWSPRYHCLGPEQLLRRLPAGYDLLPLDSLAAIMRGKGTRTGDYSPTGIPFVRTTSLINGGIDPFPDHYASPETCARFGQETQEGDLLLSIEGKIGAVAYLTELDRCVFKNHIERVRPRDPALAPDLFLALASELGQAQMRRLTVFQATLPGLATRGRQVLVPLPRQDPCRREEIPPALAQARQCLHQGLHLRRTGLELLHSAVSRTAALFTAGAS